MKDSKKAHYLLSSYVLWAVTLVVCSVAMYFAISSSNSFNDDIEESVPELSYEFPKAFVNTFLMLRISDEDAQKHFGDSSRDYRVYDLIWLDTEESLSLVGEYKEEYLSEIGGNSKDVYELYEKHSNTKVDKDTLLDIKRDLKYNAPTGPYGLYFQKNYFATIRTSNSDNTMIYFHNKPTTTTITNPNLMHVN